MSWNDKNSYVVYCLMFDWCFSNLKPELKWFQQQQLAVDNYFTTYNKLIRMIFLYRVEVVEMYQMRTRTTVLVPRGKCRLVFFDG